MSVADVSAAPGDAAMRARVAGARLARSTALNVLGQVIPLAIGAVSLPVVAHGLGDRRFGLLALLWAVLTYVSELGFGRATVKFAAEALGRGDDVELVSVAWGTSAVQAVAGFACGAALALAAPYLAARVASAPDLYGDAVVSIRVLAAALPLMMVASAVRGLLEAGQRFEAVNAIRIPAASAMFLLPMIGVWVGLGVPGIVLLLLLSRVALLVAYALVAAHHSPALLHPHVSAARLPHYVRFGGWTTLSSVVSPVLTYGDRFLLGAIVGTAAVAYYTPPFELVTRLMLLPGALVATLFPAFSTLLGLGERAHLEQLVAQSLKYILLLLGPVLVAVAANAHDILRLWLGARFAAEGTLPLQILAAGVLVVSLAFVPQALLHGAGYANLPALFYLFELPIYVVGAWLLVRGWGISGAALAWTLRVGLDTVLLFAGAARATGVTPRRLARAQLPQSAGLVALFAVATVLTAVLIPGLVARAGMTLVMGSVLVAAAWSYALHADDRARVLALLRR